MKYLVLYIFFQTVLSFQMAGQRVPDYKEIGAEITNENADFYYPKLFGRYLAADRELTVEDFRYLYYGFSFQKVYIPYADSEYRENLAVFYGKREIGKSDREQMIKYSNLILKEFPFDLQALQMLDYAYYHNKEYKKSYDAEFKRKMIVKAILSTGNGLTKGTGIHLIDDSHKFDLLKEIGLRYNGQQQLTNNVCEFLGVFENDKDIKGVYFNVSRLYQISAERLRGNGLYMKSSEY